MAKPFLGFELFDRVHPPIASSILVKSFTKRKQEYINGSSQDAQTAQKKLADPELQVLLLLSFFLNIIFPTILRSVENSTAAFLRLIRIGSIPEEDIYFLSGKLSI